jgi:hypothetical protein
MEDAVNPRQCPNENSSNLSTTQIAGGKNEDSCAARAQGGKLQRTISQSLIFREHNPTAVSDRPQPDAVLRVASEMIVVNFDDETQIGKLRS